MPGEAGKLDRGDQSPRAGGSSISGACWDVRLFLGDCWEMVSVSSGWRHLWWSRRVGMDMAWESSCDS